MFFRDMDDQFFDEFQSRDTFCNNTVIIVRSIMESHIITIICIDAGSGDHGTTKITSNVFYSNIGRTEIRFRSDVKAILMLFIDFIFDSGKRRTNVFCHPVKKGFTKSITEEAEIKVFHNTPDRVIACPTFRDEGMDMRIPFEVPAKCMEDADETRSEVFRFVNFVEHPEDDIPDRMEKTVEKSPVF